jgi:dipicolinate synthase subunit A
MSMRGKTVAVLGGDRRMTEAVHFFLKEGCQIRLAGIQWEDRFAGVEVCQSGEEALTGAHAAVLPVQGTAEDGTVFTQSGAPVVQITVEGLRRMAAGATLFVGIGNGFLRRICEDASVPMVEYREADEFAIWNSIPSAEGAIAMAMASTPFTLFGSRSLVLGFGRTGRSLALLLRGMCSDVAVAARKDLDHARIWANGYRVVPWHSVDEAVKESDVIFNTVPALVLTRERLVGLPPHAAIIDVASAPGGTDFNAAKELGIMAKLAPGLPGLVAPVTAGRIIAELIVRHLNPFCSREEGDR